MENNRVEKDGIIEVKSVEVLEAINRAEVDIQIATAKKYPRDINEALNKIATYAKMDKETAEDCFYVLRRRGANGQENVIEGLSVRMAEIIAGAWGNIRVQTRITGNDGKMITAQAICHDLETNFAVSKEVNRRITDKFGRTYSEDMQVVTGNAASSIAFRNAVLAVIPKAITKKVINEVKQVALGQSIDLEQSRQNIIIYFKKIGVSEEQILSYLDINSINEIDQAKVFELRATANAIKEGTTTVQETFVKPFEDAKQSERQGERGNGKSRKW
jgi:phosphoribosylformylglycinamidine (FGAM) synthase PurS component